MTTETSELVLKHLFNDTKINHERSLVLLLEINKGVWDHSLSGAAVDSNIQSLAKAKGLDKNEGGDYVQTHILW